MDLDFGILSSQKGGPTQHKLIGIMGLALLIAYIVLSIIFKDFREVSLRFVALFTAISKDFSLGYSLIPVYINWISSDYFQERSKTTLGNAATNGFTGLWVGIDWMRRSYMNFTETSDFVPFLGKAIISIFMFLYGLVVVKEAAQGKSVARVIGRVRTVSYFAIVITPLVYGVVPVGWTSVIAILAFYPLWYGVIEFLEFFILPKPATEGDEATEDESAYFEKEEPEESIPE